MGGSSAKKRSRDDKAARPSKKQKRQPRNDDISDDDEQDFNAVDLLDSDDDDIHNAIVDDAGAGSDSDGGHSSSDSEAGAAKPLPKKKMTLASQKPKQKARRAAKGGEEEKSDTDEGFEGGAGDDDDEEDEEDEEGENDGDASDGGAGSGEGPAPRRSKSKRNDPSSFATSMSKILSTKLPSSRRADPVLARSAAAQENAKAAADSALELKAKRHLRQQKKEALERGRVKDVLIASRNDRTGEAEASTGEMLEGERRLRKVAQRGVVKLFNAVRAAQVKAAEAERAAANAGVIGRGQKEAKVNEMSKKGFLDLIASGGGGLKRGALEEA